MFSISASYTNHLQAQTDFLKVLEQVEQGDTVIIQRPNHADVAMISANELSTLLEEVYLLKSPANNKRLFETTRFKKAKFYLGV